jgi:DtxR family transcriptional regulator, Mn-dependent transcriptional regulator
VSGDLIDTTEMYLRTIFELQEEGVVALRARIAERLHQSGPTVSQTVARMERDGLLVVGDDRRLELTDAGQAYATRVMRKHRLAERLLTDVVGLDWALVHDEACRWEHVISDDVERRLVAILDTPTVSPYGNPIPGLAELGVPPHVDVAAGDAAGPGGDGDDVTLSSLPAGRRDVVVQRLAEPLQSHHDVMTALHRVGAVPGGRVSAEPTALGVKVRGQGATVTLRDEHGQHVYVRHAD